MKHRTQGMGKIQNTGIKCWWVTETDTKGQKKKQSKTDRIEMFHKAKEKKKKFGKQNKNHDSN